MRRILVFVLLILSGNYVLGQRNVEQIIFNGNEDLVMPLGLIAIGSVVSIDCHISGSYAEDGGTYQIASDWSTLPVVIYRGEGDISQRLKFHAYLSPNSRSRAYLFATWDNKSAGLNNIIKLTLSSEGALDLSNAGEFSQAIELENLLVVHSGSNKVGIGTTTPSAKLDVAGNIKAHEIEVTLAAMHDLQLNGTLAANNITYTANGNTADFVFEDNYHLKDLSEVEAFIKANKHLPEIPSAAEMEEAGVNLAEMNKLLLMKVEELTLYAIEQEKKVDSLELKVEELKEDRRRVTELEERLVKMESLLEELSNR